MDKPIKQSEPTKIAPKSIENRFKIVREIGRGAAGVVYEGVQLSVDRRVAIKVLHQDHLQRNDYIERFTREAKAIARLSHTNCITLFDFGFSNEFGSHYMVMEYIEGEELFSITRERRLPFRIALRIGIQIAEAIAHAHRHGILHRDLKPENVLVTTDWEIKVLDFGLARLIDMFGADAGGRRLTAQGAVFGTPAYMSPEQCSGDLDVTVRSDIYSLGIILYELFEGRLPFDAQEVVKILVQHAKDPPPPMTAPIPRDVKDLVFQMLAKDPHARPRTGTQVADQLRVALFQLAQEATTDADISQEIQRSLLRGIDRGDRTGESMRIRRTEDGLEHRATPHPPERTETMDLVGHRLGEYAIGQLIGEGAMSTVFSGTGPAGKVAVKVVGRKVPDALRASDRFHTEVAALQQLAHPNIVRLLDSGHQADYDRLYLVTELVEGDDLRSICNAGRTPTELAVLVAREVASALGAAHQKGIVHRDLKPSNVMLVPQPDGRVVTKVLDFGLARLLGEPTRVTDAGMSPGSIKYMSPEQLRGQEATPASDLYALGVLLYEMLSGHVPFSGATQTDIARAALEARPAPLGQFIQEVPPALSDLVDQLLAKDPAARPASADLVRSRLEALQGQMAIREVRVNHQGRASDVAAAWRVRRRVSAPVPGQPPVQRFTSTSQQAAIVVDERPPERKQSSPWLGLVVLLLIAAAVVGGLIATGQISL